MSSTITSEQRRDVADGIQRDKDNFFSLADKVLAAAPLRQWGVWISDAVSAYFLSQFMHDVFAADGAVQGDPPPIIPITNSRTVRDTAYHQQAVLARLSRPEVEVAGRNALILCEYTKERLALSALCEPLRKAGATAVDAAVLNLDYPSRFFTPKPLNKPDNIYAGEPNKYEPAIFRGVLRDAVGQSCVLGEAEPQDDSSANLELRAFVSASFRELAQEYTALRQF